MVKGFSTGMPEAWFKVEGSSMAEANIKYYDKTAFFVIPQL